MKDRFYELIVLRTTVKTDINYTQHCNLLKREAIRNDISDKVRQKGKGLNQIKPVFSFPLVLRRAPSTSQQLPKRQAAGTTPTEARAVNDAATRAR